MKTKFVQCEFCKTEIMAEPCVFATYTTTIDGKEYTFCCPKCAERFEQSKRGTKRGTKRG
jgi:YHS domain-containing protein